MRRLAGGEPLTDAAKRRERRGAEEPEGPSDRFRWHRIASYRWKAPTIPWRYDWRCRPRKACSAIRRCARPRARGTCASKKSALAQSRDAAGARIARETARTNAVRRHSVAWSAAAVLADFGS